MLKNVLSFEGSSALSETAEVGGGVEMDGMEVVELVADGAGDAWSMVELEEAYAILRSGLKRAIENECKLTF